METSLRVDPVPPSLPFWNRIFPVNLLHRYYIVGWSITLLACSLLFLPIDKTQGVFQSQVFTTFEMVLCQWIMFSPILLLLVMQWSGKWAETPIEVPHKSFYFILSFYYGFQFVVIGLGMIFMTQGDIIFSIWKILLWLLLINNVVFLTGMGFVFYGKKIKQGQLLEEAPLISARRFAEDFVRIKNAFDILVLYVEGNQSLTEKLLNLKERYHFMTTVSIVSNRSLRDFVSLDKLQIAEKRRLVKDVHALIDQIEDWSKKPDSQS